MQSESKLELPITEKEFDCLIDLILEKYPRITDRDHATAVVSVAIRHLPNDQATTSLEYLANWIFKSIANHVANFKAEKAKHEHQVNAYFDLLKGDPNDNQARDQLQKWANEGSIAAKEALNKLEPKTEAVKDTTIQTDNNVLPIKAV